jgi:hypothetical protein
MKLSEAYLVSPDDKDQRYKLHELQIDSAYLAKLKQSD